MASLDDEDGFEEGDDDGFEILAGTEADAGISHSDLLLEHMARTGGGLAFEPVVISNTNPSSSSSSVISVLPAAAYQDETYNRFLLDSFYVLKPKPWGFPWENSVLDSGRSLPEQMLRGTFHATELPDTQVWMKSSSDEQLVARKTARAAVHFPRAVKRLQDIDAGSYKDAIRARAMNRWYLILGFCPEASATGRLMLSLVGRLKTNDDIRNFLENVLARKSTGTLLKRAGSFLKYMVYCKQRGISSLPLSESACFEYCDTLASSKDTAATTGNSFRQSIAFAGFALQFDNVTEILASKRLDGIVFRMHLKKRKLKQSGIYTVEEIRIFMMVLITFQDIYVRIFVGSVLFCIFARSRWADHQGIVELILDQDDLGNGFMQGNTEQCKTSVTVKQRSMFVPLTAPLWSFLADEYEKWWEVWLNLRDEAELVPKSGRPFCPAPSAKGGWCSRPLSAGEATAWIREILAFFGIVTDKSSHGLKATLLAWCAKFGLQPSIRLLLGYHTGGSTDSLLHYSRDALSGPLLQLNRVIREVILGNFRPDLARSAYFKKDIGELNISKVRKLNPTSKLMARPHPSTSSTVGIGQVSVGLAAVGESGSVECGGELLGGEVGSTLNSSCTFESSLNPPEQQSQSNELTVSPPVPHSETADESGASVTLAPAESSDASSSSESSSESGIDEERVLVSLGPESISKPPSAKAKEEIFYLHERLGTLHRPHSEKVDRLGCGRIISKAFRKLTNAKFSWTRCIICYPVQLKA